MGHRIFIVVAPAVFAVYMPFCTPAVRPTMPASDVAVAALWESPDDLESRDLFNGPWPVKRGPDPQATYTFVETKHHGVNPGMTVRDPQGRKWSVKQAPADGRQSEAPIEVTLSRVLSAVGYHQPPVYFLPSFTLQDESGTHVEPGGRFRLHDKSLKDVGEWSWQQNPFVGTKPFQGLLVILLMFNSSDLKNDNNTLYEHKVDGGVESWYVVRDLGTALGETGRVAPRRGDIELFERLPFILGVRNGFVNFDYHGFHQELVRGRITSDEAAWASDLMSRLSDRQWRDAFRAGGYAPDLAARFIARLRTNAAQAARIGGDDWRPAGERR
jgi:hypothetical protein